MRIYTNNGFSLVELSIVLVILGLLVGGVMGGKSLIRAAELRNITTEFERWQTAVNSFKMRYHSLPGDMPNAVRFWGAAAGGSADGPDAACRALDHTSPSVGTASCNGNGDGLIPMGGYEKFRFWQHLSNPGLIEGTYTGVHGKGGGNHEIPGQNIPRSRIGDAGWGFNEASGTSGAYWDIPYLGRNNTWIIGKQSGPHSA